MSRNLLVDCKPLGGCDDPLLDQIEITYNESFPEIERRDFSLVRELLRTNPLFSVTVLTNQGQYAGFISSWSLEGFTYLEHFAIEPAFRNGGIGGTALKRYIDAFCKLPVVLEVELPEEEISRRRVGFYERVGFVYDSHTYFQPPYRAGGSLLELRLMTFGHIDMDASFEHVKRSIHKEVYGYEE